MMKTIFYILFLFSMNLLFSQVKIEQNLNEPILIKERDNFHFQGDLGNNLKRIVKYDKMGIFDDVKKQIIIPMEYDYINPVDYDNEVFIVKKNKKSYLIDLNNQKISKTYDEIHINNNPNRSIALLGGKKVFIDNSGNEQGELYDDISTLDNIAIVKIDSLAGVITANGDTRIPMNYQDLEFISNNYFTAKKNNLWGVIDIDGNVLIDFKYENIRKNGEDYVVRKNGKFGVINSKDKFIVDYLYDEIDAHYELLRDYKIRKVKSQDKWGLIDSIGKIIIPIEYEKINFFEESKYDKRIRARKDGKWGVLDFSNQIIIPFEYNYIGPSIIIHLIDYFDRNPAEKEKVVNWDFKEDSFLYKVSKDGSTYYINEKNEFTYKQQ